MEQLAKKAKTNKNSSVVRYGSEGYKPEVVPNVLKVIHSRLEPKNKEASTMSETVFQGKVIDTKEFQAVGLKWDGPSDGDIGVLQDKMVERINEVANVINPEEVLGIAYNHRGDRNGFTLYLCVKVSELVNLPEGMTSIIVPPLKCAHIIKPKEQPVDEVYNRLHRFMDSNNLLRQQSNDMNIEVYSATHQCSSKLPFKMDIYIPVESN